MKLETVKSFALVLLIVISLVLSFSLWSYQPNSERTLGGEIVTEEMDVGGSSEETKRSMVKPTEIIFHTPDNYFGFIEATDRDVLYKEMQDWVITNFEITPGQSEFVPSGSGVELIFPDEIPMEIMNSLFTFGEEDIDFPDWSMDRIFIEFTHESKSLHIEFISTEDKQVSSAVINETKSFDELWSMIESFDNETLRKYIAINEDTSPIYIPFGSVRIPSYSITLAEVDPSKFVNILFTNPTVVRETNSQSIGETYFTDSRQLSVHHDRMRMEYVNHATSTTDEAIPISEVDLLDYSINNINSHSGWTEDYRLEDINIEKHQTSFQLYYKGYPVFNNSKLSTIRQLWGIHQNSYQLIEYDRPLYLFESELLSREVADLESGESVIAYLVNNPDISLENIQDITVSYELKYQDDQQESEFIQLDPSWYKKENNSWQKIVFDEHSSPKGAE